MGRMSVTTNADAPLIDGLTTKALYGPLGFPTLALFAGVLPGLVLLQDGPGERDLAFYLQIVLTCYAGARFAIVVLDDHIRLIQGVFWLFTYTAMGIAPLAQAVLGRTPTPVVGTSSSVATAVLLTLFGVLAYDVGSVSGRRFRVHGSALNRLTVGRARFWVLVVVAFAGSAALVAKLGLSSFFSSRQAVTSQLTDAGLAADGSQVGAALLRGFGTVPALLALLILTRWMITSPDARRRPALIALWLALLALNAVVSNPISNPRYWFLAATLALLFVAFSGNVRIYRAALVAGVLAALFLFPYADRFRYEEGGYRQVQANSILEPMALKDYDQMAMFANAVHFVEAGPGHTDGGQIAGSILFWVPRQLWPGKPDDTGVLLGEWMGTNNVNLSAPLWSEFWIDFGVAGVALGLLLVGLVSARADRLYWHQTLRDRRPASLMAVVIPILAGYELIVLRGSLLQSMGRLAVLALCVALVTAVRPTERRLT